MRNSRRFLLGLAVSVLLCLPSFSEGGVTLTDSEFQTLRTALTTADLKLTESENLIGTLQCQLKEQNMRLSTLQKELNDSERLCNEQQAQLKTLTERLTKASESLQKLKNERTGKTIKMILIGVACVAVGGAVGYFVAR